MFLNWVWKTYLLAHKELGSLFWCFPFSNLCTIKRQEQFHLPLKDQSDTKFWLDLLSLRTSIHLKYSLSNLTITGHLALPENGSIWKAAQHSKFKSKSLAALEVLKLGKVSTINKGALLSIFLKNIRPCRLEHCVHQRPSCSLPLCTKEGDTAYTRGLSFNECLKQPFPSSSPYSAP